MAIADGAFPGCTVAVGDAERLLWQAPFGHLTYARRQSVELGTLYDLASLTKVVGTTSVILTLVRDGRLALNDPVGLYLPGLPQSVGRHVTVEHLLTHSSGLPAWQPFYKDASDFDSLLKRTYDTALEAMPGERARYSDVGFLWLGEVATRAGGKPLAALEMERLFQPLGMTTTRRDPEVLGRARIAPTERLVGQRDEFLHGVVHDENALAGEGLTGHAGLFATATDLALLCRELVRGLRDQSTLFPATLLDMFTTRREIVAGSSHALGWDTPSGKSAAGDLMGRRSFGHTGFTGTSLWVDPDRELYVVLLTNRVHPTRDNPKIRTVRRTVANAIVTAVDNARSTCVTRCQQ